MIRSRSSPLIFSCRREFQSAFAVQRSKLSTNVQVTRNIASPTVSTEEDPTVLVESLLQHTRSLMDRKSLHVVAYSGGIDSSLVLKLLQEAARPDDQVQAILGSSPAVSQEQKNLARSVAQHVGASLIEVPTNEGSNNVYIANQGQACLACKTHLYSSLKAVMEHSLLQTGAGQVYNGTNANDTRDPTRLGLIAAANYKVQSPLLYTTKQQVRIAARHLGLPNYNVAASPCLRSRLALGVHATQHHLNMIQEAERHVRKSLKSVLDEASNLRVRMLTRRRARVEVDGEIVQEAMEWVKRWTPVFQQLGFASVDVAAFKSGSVAAATAPIKRIDNGPVEDDNDGLQQVAAVG